METRCQQDKAAQQPNRSNGFQQNGHHDATAEMLFQWHDNQAGQADGTAFRRCGMIGSHCYILTYWWLVLLVLFKDIRPRHQAADAIGDQCQEQETDQIERQHPQPAARPRPAAVETIQTCGQGFNDHCNNLHALLCHGRPSTHRMCNKARRAERWLYQPATMIRSQVVKQLARLSHCAARHKAIS